MGRDTFHQTSLLKASSNLALNASRDRAFITSWATWFQCLSRLIAKNFFHVQCKLTLLQFQITAHWSIATGKKSFLIFLITPFRYRMAALKCPQNLLFSWLKSSISFCVRRRDSPALWASLLPPLDSLQKIVLLGKKCRGHGRPANRCGGGGWGRCEGGDRGRGRCRTGADAGPEAGINARQGRMQGQGEMRAGGRCGVGCGANAGSRIRHHRPLPAGQGRGAGPGRAAPLPALSGGGGSGVRPLCAARPSTRRSPPRIAPTLLRWAPAAAAVAEGIGGSAHPRPAAGLPRLPPRPAAALPRLVPLPPVRATRGRLPGCCEPAARRCPELPPRRRGWRGWQRPCAPEAEGRARRRRGRRRNRRRRRRDEALPPWGRAAALAAVGGEVGREGSAALPCPAAPAAAPGSPAGFRPRSRPGAARLARGAAARTGRGRARVVIYFGVNVFAYGLGSTGGARSGVRGSCGPGWARPGAAAGAVLTGVRGGRARRGSGISLLEHGSIIRGVMEQSNTGPVRRDTSCWELPIPSRLTDCPGVAKPVSKG